MRPNKSNITELIESTSNLKISHPDQLNRKQKEPKQQQPHENNNSSKNAFEEAFSQVPKGFAYNPYKIMGFQNKETNEFAMNVLKTQVVDPNSGITAQQQPPVHTRHNNFVMQSQESVPSQQQPPLTIHHVYNNAQPPPPPPPLQQQQIPAPMGNFIVANSGVSAPINLTPQSSYSWNFKVGDRCLAKYWEDERVILF